MDFLILLLVSSVLTFLLLNSACLVISLIEKDYCPFPISICLVISLLILLIVMHSYFLIFFIIYLLLGYFLSFKFYKKYWENNYFGFSYIRDFEAKNMLMDMIIFWPFVGIMYLFKKIDFKNPISNLEKRQD